MWQLQYGQDFIWSPLCCVAYAATCCTGRLLAVKLLTAAASLAATKQQTGWAAAHVLRCSVK